MFSVRPKHKIVATILAKNEADIIGQNIEHHLEHGVTHFIVTDNNSTDNTRKIVEKYPEVVEIIDEEGDNHHQCKWVTRMAQMACKLDPDWIVHLDADELWCGIPQLMKINARAVGSVRMFLHPPVQKLEYFDAQQMRHYLSFDKINIDSECKVAHRPDPEIEITHGNHGFVGDSVVRYTKLIYRHHYPIRSYEQFERKTVQGHEALQKRNAPCARWQNWYNLWSQGALEQLYQSVTFAWSRFVQNPNFDDLMKLLSIWSTEEVLDYFRKTRNMPEIGEWPKYEKESVHHQGMVESGSRNDIRCL